jgi:MFS superfamily sulfate permease-like transporter
VTRPDGDAAGFVAPRLPGALIVVIAAIVVSKALSLDEHGVAIVGEIPPGLPDLRLPNPSWEDVITLAPAAAGVFFVSFADEMLTARSFAGRHGQHVRADQELLAMGVANAAAGVTGGLPIGASGSRTAVNDSMGARSQIAGLLAASAIVLVLLLLTAPIADLPKAVLGAVIITAAIGLIEPAVWRELAGTDHVELAIAAVTAAGVVLTGVLEAIVFAAGLSLVDVVRRSAPAPTTPSWGGSTRSDAGPTSRATTTRAWPPASWSTGSTTACSLPTPATSRAESRKHCTARRPRRPRSSWTPRR